MTAGPRKLVILGYHRIGEPPPGSWETWFSVPEGIFADQLRYVHGAGWEVIDLETLLTGLDEPETLPERAALITFDDGYRSIRGAALACLRRLGYPATLFVPTDFVGASNAWDAESVEPEEPICSWDDLLDLQRCGVSIQSHGVTHRRFSELDPREQVLELMRSKAVLEEQLEKPVELFAYPYGDTGRDSVALEQALRRAAYRAACLYGGGPMDLPGHDPYRLERVAMGADTDLEVELGRLAPRRLPSNGIRPTPRDVLERGLCDHYGRNVRITSIDTQPHAAASTYPLDRLRVSLDSGEQLRVMFKRLHPELEPEGNRNEVLIYQRLLAGGRFGAPNLYASHYDEESETYWLFLEDVGSWMLEFGDVEEWAAITRWLAQLGATWLGREDELRALGCLGEHGPDYYYAVVEGAERNLRQVGVLIADRIGWVDQVIDYLVCQPRTLVHGDLTATNVLFDQEGGRVRPIDWENAAVGAPTWDLARVFEGWEEDGEDAPYLELYLSELELQSPVPLERAALARAYTYSQAMTQLWLFNKQFGCDDPWYVKRFLATAERMGDFAATEGLHA